MSALPPLLPGGSPPQPAASSFVLTLVDAPAEVDALPAGARITGVVVSPGSGTGTVTIKTPLGTLMGEAALPLQKGAAVSLLVQTGAPGMVLRVGPAGLSPCARTAVTTAGGPATMGTAGSGDSTAAAASHARTAGAAGTAGARIEAIVLRPCAGVPSGPSAGSAGPLGATAEPEAQPLFPAGTRLSMRILAADHPPAAASAPAGGSSPSPAHAQVGSVIGSTIRASLVCTDGAGRPLLASSAGPLVLATPVHLPPQWCGELEILALQTAPLAGTIAEGREPGGPRPTTEWRTLEEILGVLSQAAPEAARQLRETGLPQPTSGLAAGLLKILGHLRRGSVHGWLGEDACQALARSRPDLLERLGVEMRRLAAHADPGTSGEWRIFSLPLLADGALTAITMRVRNHSQPDGAEGIDTTDSMRFVLDLTLSRLGRMQIDGLLQAQDQQLDLIVRTDHPLAGEAQNGIRHILAEANTATGLRAAVCFRAVPAEFLDTAAPDDRPGRLKESLLV